jgi:hypothetical protein
MGTRSVAKSSRGSLEAPPPPSRLIRRGVTEGRQAAGLHTRYTGRTAVPGVSSCHVTWYMDTRATQWGGQQQQPAAAAAAARMINMSCPAMTLVARLWRPYLESLNSAAGDGFRHPQVAGHDEASHALGDHLQHSRGSSGRAAAVTQHNRPAAAAAAAAAGGSTGRDSQQLAAAGWQAGMTLVPLNVGIRPKNCPLSDA